MQDIPVYLSQDIIDALKMYGHKAAKVYWNGQLLTPNSEAFTSVVDKLGDYHFDMEKGAIFFAGDVLYGAVLNIDFPNQNERYLCDCAWRFRSLTYSL